MLSVLVVAIVCLTTVYLWRDFKPIALRLVAVHERRYAPTHELPEGPGSPIPDDLLDIVNNLSTGASESDELLRQQTVALLYEKAAEFNGDWDKVRAWSAINIAPDSTSGGGFWNS